MSQKGLYKKTIGSGWDHSPDSQRPREKRFFEKAESGQVGKKNKSKAEGKPRANHRHAYEIVLIWRKSHFSNNSLCICKSAPIESPIIILCPQLIISINSFFAFNESTSIVLEPPTKIIF